jgi:lipid II:glycine glycyltransferase (peptidoglycan interpeptide bridge formation enzyme)
MRLFEGEDDTKVVLFAVYANAQCTMHNAQLDAIGDMDKSRLLLLQPVVIQRFVKWLPWRLGAYAVAWREPWRAEYISNEDAQQLFEVLQKAINQYCRRKAIYIEYRHFSENNIYHLIFNAQRSTLKLPWFNIYQKFNAGESVDVEMNKSKRKQLRQSFKSGVNIELNPNDDEIREWYVLLQKLYRRIHRPLPSLQVFLKLNNSGIGKVFVVKYQNKVISGSAILYLLSKEKNSQLFYDWYRASIKEPIEGVYPSVVSTWQAMQLVAEMGGGTFDVMGAGPRNKSYGVRDFKLTFGGELTPEYRYRKWL